MEFLWSRKTCVLKLLSRKKWRRSRGSLCAQHSWTPPAGRENPFGIGMEEAPNNDGRGDEKQAKDLITAEGTALFVAALLFGDLLIVRLDPAVDHAGWKR